MVNNFELTMKDILQRKIFQHAKVIAGKNGLNKQVRWTHILETNQFESLINGGELILTTGSGLKLESSTELTYIQNLINRHAAGICIEIGTHVTYISDEIIELADQHQFPIIIFDHFVKFVDITQDLHSLIINQHHQMLHQLYELSTRFNELSLLPNGILKILQELHTYLKKDILYLTDEAKAYYYPPKIKYIEEKMRECLSEYTPSPAKETFISLDDKQFAVVPVKGLGQIWGYLCLQAEESILKDFLFSIMDRAALAIAQIMLRNRTVEERKQNIEDKMVRNLLHGKACDTDELQAIIPLSANSSHYRLVLIQTNQSEINAMEGDWNEIKLQRSVIFRTLFKQHGLYPAVSVRKNDIAVIASFKLKGSETQGRNQFTQVMRSIKKLLARNILDGSKCVFGISRVNQDINALANSYQQAKRVLFLQNANIISSAFYEKIGVYQLLLTHQKSHLKLYIDDCLEPLIRYDRETHSELLRTLEVYLDCYGSKKETAEKLFIVRQTLYHRLKKIGELIGSDFMKPDNRLALEMAIKAFYMKDAIKND